MAAHSDESIGMADRQFIVRCKSPELGTQAVMADRVEIHDEHLVFINAKGEMAAMFLLEVVESWSEHDGRPKTNGSNQA